MLIPLRCEPPPRRSPLVVPFLIGANVAVLVAGLLGERMLGWEVEALVRRGALDPRDFAWWQLFSYQFLHDPWGIFHLLFNMVFLWVFGIAVEDRLGRLGFLGFYLLGGAIAGLLQIALSPAPVIGASGATAAVAGGFLALFPRGRITVLLFFLLIGVYSIPAVWFIGLYVALDILGALAEVVGGRSRGVAFAAHLGGYAYGLGAGLLLLATGLVPRGPLDLLYLVQQARRRRAMRQVAARGGDPFRGHRMHRDPTAAPPVENRRRRGAPPPPPPPPDLEELLRQRRAEVGALLRAERPSEALRAYTALLRQYPQEILSLETEEGIATHLQSAGRLREAAAAWSRLLEHHPHAPRRDEIRLLLAALLLRHLDAPAEARRHLEMLDPRDLGGSLRNLHETLAAELAATTPPAAAS